jgi:hypothetical protein
MGNTLNFTRVEPLKCPPHCLLATDAATPKIKRGSKALLKITPILGHNPRSPITASVIGAMNPKMPARQ